ncbi:PREDICTED: rapid alkalinization factor 23-like [Nelumbo nucifera]|uniref:Rapid alkalinization factor 23-like n=1 Tax=Nelumbo nucifera TaxID=4432 RepID=A0A1U8Q7M0_NELNU|nr:PREDICTED: rapid alkalinization factor 23-like [Nelumbo nucifera]
MANSSGLCMVVATLIISALMITSSPYSVEASGVYSKLDWLPLKTSCQGTIAECLGGKEFDMDSESNRRILATTDYISYRALQSGNSFALASLSYKVYVSEFAVSV